MQTTELMIVPARRTSSTPERAAPAWEITLTPAQRLAEQNLMEGIGADGVDALVLRGEAGFGKTTILERVQQAAGGVLLGMEQFTELLAERQPGAIEETFRDLIEYALASHDLAIVDDLHLIMEVVQSCDYPRGNLLNAMLTAILAGARARGKKLLFAVDDDRPFPLERRAYSWKIANFTPEDYETICRFHLG